MKTHDTPAIGQHLDALFASVAPGEEASELKEELRGNLEARIAELKDSGVGAAEATARALSEIGDIDGLLAPLRAGGAPGQESAAALYRRHKVRVRPVFAMRVVLLSVVIALGLVLVTFAACNVLAWSVGAQVALSVGAIAVPSGFLVADSLRQETTTSFPLPRARAAYYGIATAVGIAGLAPGLAIADDPASLWPLAVGVPLIVASGLLFTVVGVTQTNRKKPWARDLERRMDIPSRLESDPVAGARFGMYAGAIWLIAMAVFIYVVIAISALWALAVIVAAVVATMLLLARMEFSSAPRDDARR